MRYPGTKKLIFGSANVGSPPNIKHKKVVLISEMFGYLWIID